jgi:hypothetical protein
MRPVENPVQVPHAGGAVDRLPELGELDGDRRVQVAGRDRTGRLLVLVDGVRRACQVGDPLAEQVENAADAVRVELGGHRERLVEPLACDEAVRDPPGDLVLGDLPLEAGTAGGPQQEPVDHRASHAPAHDVVGAAAGVE